MKKQKSHYWNFLTRSKTFYTIIKVSMVVINFRFTSFIYFAITFNLYLHIFQFRKHTNNLCLQLSILIWTSPFSLIPNILFWFTRVCGLMKPHTLVISKNVLVQIKSVKNVKRLISPGKLACKVEMQSNWDFIFLSILWDV